MDDDDYGGALAIGDGASICMPELALEDELFNEWEDPERVTLSFSFFIILQKNQQNNKTRGTG